MAHTIEISSIYIIYLVAFLGLGFGSYCAMNLIKLNAKYRKEKDDIERGHERLSNVEAGQEAEEEEENITDEQVEKIRQTGATIAKGAADLIFKEYTWLTIIVALFTVLIYLLCEKKFYTFYSVIAYLLGAFTAMAIGIIAVKVATVANYKSAFNAGKYGDTLVPSYHAGCVIAFFSVSLSIIIIASLTLIYKAISFSEEPTTAEYALLFERVASFGFGAVTVALFSRVGTGIFAKGADIGADLVSKLSFKLEEDDYRNAAVHADTIGDMVGQSCGLATDVFALISEAIIISLMFSGTSKEIIDGGLTLFPMVVESFGIVVCMITVLGCYIFIDNTSSANGVNLLLKLQVLISSAIMVPVLCMIALYFLPDFYSIGAIGTIFHKEHVGSRIGMVCLLIGLFAGVVIGLFNEFFNSRHAPGIPKLLNGCKSSPSINIILGLSFGYLSTIFPSVIIAFAILGTYILSGMFGVALAALGMISIVPTVIIVIAIAPISDNAKGISTYSGVKESVLAIHDNINEAADSTHSMCKGFTTGGMCLIAIATFGAFINNAGLVSVNAFTPIVLAGLILGAMIPYFISAFMMSSVGSLAMKLAVHVEKEFKAHKSNNSHRIDTDSFITEARDYSTGRMFVVAAILILIIFVLGIFFGVTAVAGLIVGVIISSLQLMISFDNSGVIWDQLKNLIKDDGVPLVGVERYVAERKDLLNKLEDLEDEKLFADADEEWAKLEKIKEEIEEMQAKIDKLTALIEEITIDPTHQEKSLVVKVKSRSVGVYKTSLKSSIVGDLVGDPMKNAIAPSLGLSVRFYTFLALVFVQLFLNTSVFIKSN